MKAGEKTCFVCKKIVSDENSELNLVVNMPVCKTCKGSEQEKVTEKEFLESLADGFVCGCI
jgi:hypothetical protein